jgi:predicted nucleic acid-binding protein
LIILDTNVVSEGFKARPHDSVRLWSDLQASQTLFICTPVLAEIRFGIALMGDGARKNGLKAAADGLEYDLYSGRILSFDVFAASIYGRIAAARQLSGKPIGHFDGMIAAIALAYGASVATRDTHGFADVGLNVINPFDFAP